MFNGLKNGCSLCACITTCKYKNMEHCNEARKDCSFLFPHSMIMTSSQVRGGWLNFKFSKIWEKYLGWSIKTIDNLLCYNFISVTPLSSSGRRLALIGQTVSEKKTGIFFSNFGKGPSAFPSGKISDVTLNLGNFQNIQN